MLIDHFTTTQMDSSFLPIFVAAAICFFLIFRKFRSHQENKDFDSSSLPNSSPLPSSSSVSSVPSSSHSWIHDVFPSFRGEDVRIDFLSHIQKEFKRKGITPFNDNGIKRGESIGQELIRAIRGSKIAIILFSKNYASSKWCLDELVEIMKCKEELGQTVMVVFYKVDPSDVKKLTGHFGKVFRKTCEGKTKEDIGRWKQALEKVATIAGYDSSNWDNEAAMIEEIATDISNELINSVPSSDFNGFVGMIAHMQNMKLLLGLESNEVRMIGIWGPSGIGKSTIARALHSIYSHDFEFSVFMENIKRCYPRPCFDEYTAKLQLQEKFLSQIINQKDLKINHLSVAKNRLKDKRVFVVLDDVDKSAQLDAMAKETRWFGPGSRIIVTTQDKKILNAHGINQIYKVDFPPDDEALQIFCMYAFGQNSPYDGFKKLACEVTKLAGNLPLGLRVMGSYFKGMSKEEWEEELPRLRNRLDGEIESILQFSYDALCHEDQALFLHIACLFNHTPIEKLEAYLAENFVGVKGRLRGLVEKSLISFQSGNIHMHNLLARLGREIVRKQSSDEPGQRQFLVDDRDTYQVLHNDSVGSQSVLGIQLMYYKEELKISFGAFEKMSNVQFLSMEITDAHVESLKYLPPKLKLLCWNYCPLTFLPSNFNPEFLVEIQMFDSNLEKLWEGNKTIRNLKWVSLYNSRNLKELPDLSTATNLQDLILTGCSSLVGLPSSIGYMTKFSALHLRGCSSLLDIPPSIGNMTNLKALFLNHCSNLLELPSSIGNLHNLQTLELQGCLKLKVLPININMKSLDELNLTDCSSLKIFPEISTNIGVLKLEGTAIEEIPPSIRSWSRLHSLHMPYCENLGKSQHAFARITELHLRDTRIQEIAPWVKEMSRLQKLIIKGCTKLVSLPQLPDSLYFLDAANCESLERLEYCSFYKTKIDTLIFINCFKLNQEARDLIIKTWAKVILPGENVPTYSTYRATGSSISLSMKWNGLDTHFPTYLRLKVCVLVLNKSDAEAYDWEGARISYRFKDKLSGVIVDSGDSYLWDRLSPTSKEHLVVFEFDTKVTFAEAVVEFEVNNEKWELKECGIYVP